MNTLRKELFDFIYWYKLNIGVTDCESWIDAYLNEKSNNSLTSDEALTLGNNEQKKMKCDMQFINHDFCKSINLDCKTCPHNKY